MGDDIISFTVWKDKTMVTKKWGDRGGGDGRGRNAQTDRLLLGTPHPSLPYSFIFMTEAQPPRPPGYLMVHPLTLTPEGFGKDSRCVRTFWKSGYQDGIRCVRDVCGGDTFEAQSRSGRDGEGLGCKAGLIPVTGERGGRGLDGDELQAAVRLRERPGQVMGVPQQDDWLEESFIERSSLPLVLGATWAQQLEPRRGRGSGLQSLPFPCPTFLCPPERQEVKRGKTGLSHFVGRSSHTP